MANVSTAGDSHAEMITVDIMLVERKKKIPDWEMQRKGRNMRKVNQRERNDDVSMVRNQN